jgi:hypothetical protein
MTLMLLLSHALMCSGQLAVGEIQTATTREAHIIGVGNTIRMVMHHFIILKKCRFAKDIAFRKARFSKFGLSVLVLI